MPDEFHAIRALVADKLFASAHLLHATYTHTPVALIQHITEHLTSTGGKQLRPLLLLLSAQACGYHGETDQILAAALECIHSASLLHDDVVDTATLRRGKPTANTLWGNAAPVLVGDFLYAQVFQLLVQSGSLPILARLATATACIAEGEILQLSHRHDPCLSRDTYLQIIRAKTATLFEVAAEVGGMLAGVDPETQRCLAQYGQHLGIAFQMIDDALDYRADPTFGKDLGGDLAEGKTTLPLIYALEQAEPAEHALLTQAILHGETPDLAAIQQILTHTGAYAYTAQQATAHAHTACSILAPLRGTLPGTPAFEALHTLTQLAVTRRM